jgi:hypothetical protein
MTITKTMQVACKNVQNKGLATIVATTMAVDDAMADFSFPMPKNIPEYQDAAWQLQQTIDNTYVGQMMVSVYAALAIGIAVVTYMNQPYNGQEEGK